MRNVRYEFFVSELFEAPDKEAGYAVELMRCASHVRDFQRFFAMLGTPSSMDDADAVEFDVGIDSLRIVSMNFAASQMREVLKFYAEFRKSTAYSRIGRRLSQEGKDAARYLDECVDEFESGKGFLREVLKPLRNKTFHYDAVGAQDWIHRRMALEAERKPPMTYAEPARHVFGPGIEYDQDLYARHLFHDADAESIMTPQIRVWNLQKRFLTFVKSMTAALLKDAKVSGDRPFGWVLEHQGGYRRDE